MSPLAPYRKAIGTFIGALITGLTWVIATDADPTDWRTWAQMCLFLLVAAATFVSPANAEPAPAPIVVAPLPGMSPGGVTTWTTPGGTTMTYPTASSSIAATQPGSDAS